MIFINIFYFVYHLKEMSLCFVYTGTVKKISIPFRVSNLRTCM